MGAFSLEPSSAAPGDKTSPRPAGFRWPEERRPLPPEPPPEPKAGPSWEVIGQRAILAIGLAASLWIYFVPAPAGLTIQGKTACAVFLLCTTLWITNAVPFGVTGLLAIAVEVAQEIGRASCRERCDLCRSRWSPYH